MIAKVFHVLKWTPKELERTVDVLLQEGRLREMTLKGQDTDYLVYDRG